MAVFEYKCGDLSTGFVGFRAVTTVGSDEDYRQKWYSINEYSYDQAKYLAEEQDATWREEAEEVARQNLISGKNARGMTGEGLVGLRPYIRVDRKGRSKAVRYYPVFLVSRVGYGKGALSFNIANLGYQKAWKQACDKYAEIRDLNEREKEILLTKMPRKSIFTGRLFDQLIKNGHKPNIMNIFEMLN